MNDTLKIGNKIFHSRLFLGTGKFSSPEMMLEAVQASHTEMVTVAMKRLDFEDSETKQMSDYLDPEKLLILPNTSGAATAEEAVLLAKLAHNAGLPKWIKLEIHPDPRYLLPDPIETLKAAEILCKEGFTVLPYINADPVLAKRLEEVGTAAVMPLGSPIGSNNGINTREMIAIIIEQSTIPIVIDAGLGAPSHAVEAMEMGADACLVNTAIAASQNPAKIAEAFSQAVIAGRTAFNYGMAPKNEIASATSPLLSFLSK